MSQSGLPMLPGFTFRNPLQQSYHIPHQFTLIHGFNIPLNKHAAIGGEPCEVDKIAYQKTDELCGYDSTLTYGRTRKPPVPPFIPHYVKYSQKCLGFKAFMKQSVFNSPAEHYRVRHVKITYFLEDGTINVFEKQVHNMGYSAGTLVKRSKVQRNESEEMLNWHDLNIGEEVLIHGIVYHIYDCDPFTKEFLKSHGILVPEAEKAPNDPYLLRRHLVERSIPALNNIARPLDDKLGRFLEFDGKVLKFDALWDDRETEFGDCREFTLCYFLFDDTIKVIEIFPPNSGRDPVRTLISKIKVPINWDDYPVTWPSICLERGDPEVTEYIQPKHLLVGTTIIILGRKFFLYDCDNFTRKYYLHCLNITQKPRMDVRPLAAPPVSVCIAQHLPVEKPEHSFEPVYQNTPKHPHKDSAKGLYLGSEPPLRWEAVMDDIHPEYKIRKFIIMYYLGDSTFKIVEKYGRNSGLEYGMGRTFLKNMLVPKPGTSRDNPEFYSPEDIYIGSIVQMFATRFKITGGDLRVYRYMCSNRNKFTPEQIDNMRNFQILAGNMTEDLKDQIIKDEKEKRQAYFHALTELEPPKPRSLDICLDSVTKTSQKPTLDINYTECPDQYEDYLKIIDRIHNPVDDLAEKRATALEKARNFDTQCYKKPPKYGIHLNKNSCPYEVIPKRPESVLEKVDKFNVYVPIRAKAKECDKSFIFPMPAAKATPFYNPCDNDRCD